MTETVKIKALVYRERKQDRRSRVSGLLIQNLPCEEDCKKYKMGASSLLERIRNNFPYPVCLYSTLLQCSAHTVKQEFMRYFPSFLIIIIRINKFREINNTVTLSVYQLFSTQYILHKLLFMGILKTININIIFNLILVAHTGPAKDTSPAGDRKLAQSAQMYHYQVC